MKGIFAVAFLMTTTIVFSQTLTKKVMWKTNALSETKVEWIDVDNDSLLDVLVLAKGTNQKMQVLAYQNKLDSFSRKAIAEVDFALNSYSLVDLNGDNKVDFSVNGTKSTSNTQVFLNQGNFKFNSITQNLPNERIVTHTWVDFNMDGRLDLVMGGANFLRIFQQTSSGFSVKLDSTGITISSIATGDFNKDGRLDFIVSGKQTAAPFLVLFQNNYSFKFKKIAIGKPKTGLVNLGDFNHDGKFDFVLNGQSPNGSNGIFYFQNTGNNFWQVDSLMGYSRGEILIADFKSTGISQTSYNGRNELGKKVNLVRDTFKLISQLDTTQLISQRWGDYDRDGDLDLLQVRDSLGYTLFQVFENQTAAKNKSPQKRGITFTVSAYGKSIIYWDSAFDDKTNTKALSYDLLVTRGNAPLPTRVSPFFDLSSTKRLITSHGNMLTNNFAFLPKPNEPFGYVVQPVDNAFNGGGKGHCYGGESKPGSGSCQVTEEYVQTCSDGKSSLKKLQREQPAYWFSFTNGFKGLSSTLTLDSSEPDTVISVVYKPTGCLSVVATIIQSNPQQLVENETRFICQGKPVKLGIRSGWEKVLWKYGETTSTSDSITITTVKAMDVTVDASTGNCSYKKNISLKVSAPEPAIENDQYIIMQGESVQLGVSGGDKYEWLPNVALSNNQIANPIASPLQTTQYEVTASDSLGCTKKASVKVEVINTGFLPNMFTPNGDGKNDDYKILGLRGASEFEFVIYNREGNIVYETSSWQLATNTGWNGQKNGVNQPSGLYYWKVSGKQSNGQSLLLNGKNSGSVLLIR